MKQPKETTDWTKWFSTYGILTAERILERFNIHLHHDELISSIKNTNTIYFHLLNIPLKNVFNGIIFQQARDLQVYIQKLFVDYLLSGEDAKDETSPGASLRQDMEQIRLQLIQTSEEFQHVETAHLVLINESQRHIMQLTQDISVLNPETLRQNMKPFEPRVEEVNINLRSFRRQFYDYVLRVTELLKLMPDYHFDENKRAQNLVSLEFDALIGE